MNHTLKCTKCGRDFDILHEYYEEGRYCTVRQCRRCKASHVFKDDKPTGKGRQHGVAAISKEER